MTPLPIIKGRGTQANPENRFERIDLEPDGEWLDEALADGEQPQPRSTIYLRDTSRSLIATNDSLDVGFEKSINPYRGCEHG